MTWFHSLTGLRADDPVTVRENIRVTGTRLTSAANGRTMDAGKLTIPSLADLKCDIPDHSPTHLRECVADVQELHCDPANAGALFQVASQFNLLEMISPDVAPEDGIARYGHDKTQGPACAIACGAGTIWRNYMVDTGHDRRGVGQNSWYQIDTLADLGTALGNHDETLWEMRNGYVLPKPNGLDQVSQAIENSDVATLGNKLRIGLQCGTEVTLHDAGHKVTQAYCSALPVAYSGVPAAQWEPFGRLVLRAAYHATYYAALRNWTRTGSNKMFLTLLGGGAFGNPTDWILDAFADAHTAFAQAGLNVQIVSYGQPNPDLRRLTQA